ncbi:alpha-kinase family-domain-containing protein, partial [Mycena vitilis]
LGVVHQVKLLLMEIRCLAWGHVLLNLVYVFIRRFIRDNSRKPPFDIPDLRFVQAALFFHPTADGKSDASLVEQRIQLPQGKRFVKYINNRATIPTEFTDAEDNERAAFLSFTQHYQYIRTFKMVFVSDYQGAAGLLTDPQIMTSPRFQENGRHLFAEGNVASGFDSFEVDHKCNKYCRFFELSDNYDDEVEAKSPAAASSQSSGTKAMDISVA